MELQEGSSQKKSHRVFLFYTNSYQLKPKSESFPLLMTRVFDNYNRFTPESLNYNH